jgi:hypothetical protein
MRYHAPSNQFTVSRSDLEHASQCLLYAIANIRELAKKPAVRYARKGALRADDYAMKGILDAAKSLGIDLGADWGNELDVSDAK